MNDPNVDAPKPIRDMILRFAGTNPYGKPIWRACLAQHVTARRGGVFHNLEGGRKTMFVYGPDGKRYYQPIGDRVTTGFMDVPKYPHKGWIMERWMPPHLYGTKQEWEAQKSEDGTPMMGPFPSEGDYFLINGPFPKMPDWGDMENAIAHYEKQQRMRPTDFASALKQFMKNERDEQEAKRQAFEDELEQMRVSELLPMLKSTSLSAQRFRNALNASIGDRSHFGVL